MFHAAVTHIIPLINSPPAAVLDLFSAFCRREGLKF